MFVALFALPSSFTDIVTAVENEPLIPANTQFLLTTYSVLVPQPQPSSSTDFGLNSHANQRYFDRPDVIQAYREQQIIQTPEFTTLSEDASVGGRFRPRISAEVRSSVNLTLWRELIPEMIST
jgi:hypothetical protein